MNANALARITRRHRFGTLQDVSFAVALGVMFAVGVAQLVLPMTS